jgi:hypothetical protein
MPPYGIDTLLNRNFDAQGFFESPVESIYDPAFGTLNSQTAYGPAPYTGNIPLTSYRVQPGIKYLSDVDGRFKNLGFQGDFELPSFGGASNPNFNQFGKDIDFINTPQDTYPAAVPPDFINTPQNFYPPNLTSTKGLPTLDLQNLPANMGVANQEDVEQVDSLTGQKKSTGIMDLIMSVAIPGYGFFKNIARGGMDGIRGLNQRIQQSDFGQSKTLADYFDARSYGGRDERDRAASQNMREARAIQRQVDMRGDSTSRVADRNRGSVTTASAAKSRGVGGGGYTRSDSTRDSFRGRY